MSFPLEALQSRLQGKYPHIQAFLHRIQQRPAFQKANKSLVLRKIVLIFKRKGTNICSFFINLYLRLITIESIPLCCNVC
jgi:hypothetical protein